MRLIQLIISRNLLDITGAETNVIDIEDKYSRTDHSIFLFGANAQQIQSHIILHHNKVVQILVE